MEVKNQKDFYNKINVDEFNNVVTSKGVKVGTEKICTSQYEFFKSVKLDENGNLKVYK